MGECHYLDGNAHAAIQMDVVQTLLDRSGIGKDRLCLRWVSAAEGQLFARYVAEYTEAIKSMGPFYADDFQPALKAVRAALTSERLRWLMGMGLQLQEKGNVYGDRLDADTYKQRLHEVAGEEFEKALVLGAISETPRSVREIALETGLGIYQTASRLNALEQAHRAAFVCFEGPVSRFQAA